MRFARIHDMDSLADELLRLREDIAEIRDHCEKSYNEVNKKLLLKEIALDKLYEHNIRLVKEKHDCKNK